MARCPRPGPPGAGTRQAARGRRHGRRPGRDAWPDRGLPLAARARRRRGGAREQGLHPSLRTGGPVARLRPTGEGNRVQVLWWRREAWGNPGPFGREVMPLEDALDFIAAEGFFWTLAS